MNKTRAALVYMARHNDITARELDEAIEIARLPKCFDPAHWDGYVECLNREAVWKKKQGILLREKQARLEERQEPLAERCTAALKRWGQRKWLFPPIKRTPAGDYVPDPKGTIEGEVVYGGVLNE